MGLVGLWGKGGGGVIPGMENLGLRWRQIRFNPLRSLTPSRLSSALDMAAAGWLREAALIFETIEQREAVVRSVMTKRRAAVARRDWQVITPDPEHPNAEAHKATLDYFYENLTVTDATDLNVRSGMSGLLRQMMDAIIQRYAVHEIVWKPGPEGLTAELRRVPLYFFENRSGRLRFIGPETRADGIALEEDGWMVTVADGLGEALSICYMFKRLAIQDAMAFSEKFSVPGVLGRTTAAKDTPEGNAARDSVLAYASEWIGINYSDDGTIKDPIQVIQTPGGSGAMPSMTLAEYMDRMIAILVRGGDLSTISREGDSSGSNRQQDETDALLEDDCAFISETLQIQLDRAVIRMVHGDETPAAYVVVNPPSNQDLAGDLAIDEGLARLGVTQDAEDLAERYGREVVEKAEILNAETLKEEVLKVAENESGWESFARETGTLGIPRDIMPQIQGGNRAAMVNKLRSYGVDYVVTEMKPSDLKPTQAEYSLEKLASAAAYQGTPRAILVSSDHHVVDGHHQYLSALRAAPNTPIPVFKIKTPIMHVLGIILQMKSTQQELTANESGEDADPMQELRKALAADLQPLGDALQGAYQAGDFAAMQAALKKISKSMPELAGDAAAMTEVLSEQFSTAYLTETIN